MKKKPDRKCDCDAIVWCHIDGYLIKPRPVKRTKRVRPSTQAKELVWNVANSENQPVSAL